MKIFFYAGRCIPVHASTLDERPLGGTETGLIRVAALLEQAGHDVTVFTSHSAPPHSSPRYLSAAAIMQEPACDILVVVQDWWGVFCPVRCRKRFFWTGDAPDQFMNFGIGDRRAIARIDRLLAVSDWQGRNLADASGFPHEKVRVVRNGVHRDWFTGSEERHLKRLIYTPSPLRGLEHAAPLFIELRRRHPELVFHIFSGLGVYEKDKPFEGPQAQQFAVLQKVFSKIPGCVLEGNVSQRQLAREYMKSGLFFYPCVFPESSCITALEAQAGGCPIVSSDYAALPETVGDAGLLIKGRPGSSEYSSAFIAAADKLITDRTLWQRCSNAGLKRVTEMYSWEHVALRFESVFEEEI